MDNTKKTGRSNQNLDRSNKRSDQSSDRGIKSNDMQDRASQGVQSDRSQQGMKNDANVGADTDTNDRNSSRDRTNT